MKPILMCPVCVTVELDVSLDGDPQWEDYHITCPSCGEFTMEVESIDDLLWREEFSKIDE